MKIDNDEKKWLMATVGLLLMLVIIIVIPNIIISSDIIRTRIGNWEEIGLQIPEESKVRIEEVLYNQIEMNIENKSLIPSSGAMIRTDTQRNIETDVSIVAGDFIVDIPSIRQSYIIQYFYSDDLTVSQMEFNDGQEIEASASVTSYCVTNQEEIIYSDFICMDTYGAYDSDGRVDAFYLKFLLPHTIALSSDEEVVVKMGGYDNFGVPKFNIMVASCKQDSNINREAESVVRSWVEEIGFDPNLFVYDVIIEYNYCVMK